MNSVKFLSLAEMNSAIATQEAYVADIGATVEKKLAIGPIEAQAKRLVAQRLAADAAHILRAASNHADFLFIGEKPADEDSSGSQKHGETQPLEVIDVQEAIAIAMAKQVGFAREAVLPFVVECISIRLALSSDLLNQAKLKLAEADAIEAIAS